MTEKIRRRKARKPPIEMDLRLADWASRGYTMAECDGRAIQVDRGIPGEHVLAAVDRRSRPWRGMVDRVLEPSADRVDAPCPYYAARCGGCQWQHLGYQAQVTAKRKLVDRELERAGVGARVRTVRSMHEPWRYRHTAAIALGWEAGFRPRARRGIVEIHDCPISHPLIGQVADALNELLRRPGELPNYHGKVWLDCTIVGRLTSPAVQVVIQGITGLTLETHPELPDVAASIASIPMVRGVAYRLRSGEVRPLIGNLLDTIEIAGRDMWFPAGSFSQTNRDLLARVLDDMTRALGDSRVRHAADVYGGIGTFGLRIAPLVERVTIVELDGVAVEAARRTAADWGLSNVEFVSLHAERAVPDVTELDLVIVDPPRSGLGDSVVSSLVDSDARLLFYLSCAPPSLARDLSALQVGGYRVRDLTIYDFYPQTYHVESLAILER